MTLVRLSAIAVLSVHILQVEFTKNLNCILFSDEVDLYQFIFLQVTLAQQLVLGNNPREIDNIPKAPSSSSLVSSTKNYKLNCDTNTNTEAKSNKLNGLIGFQHFLNLQQPVVSLQHSSNVNLQQPTIYQTLQQPVSNENLPIKLQQQFQSLPLKLENQILQQPDIQIIQKQCKQLQQQGPAATTWNSHKGRKPLSSLRVTGVSLAPLPVNSDTSRILPSQISHGGQLSNLGLPSNLPYFADKFCGCVNTEDQIPVVVPQPNHGPISNVPISVVERIQWPINMPIPISASSLSTDRVNLKIPIELTPSTVPVSTAPQKIESQSIQSIDLAPMIASTAYQSPLNQVTLTQSQPFEVKQEVQPVKYQMPPNQLRLNSVELNGLHTPQAVECQPPSNQIQVVDSQSVIQLQRPIPTPFVTNQNLHSDTLPINYPAPFVTQNSHSLKSSSMKTLLQLLMGLINERHVRCQYPHNYNCGCMNNNVCNSVNNNDTQIPPPEVIEGCTNRRKYESEESPMSNNIVPEGQKTPIHILEKMKFRNDNNRQNYSEEEDDDEYEYDDED